MNTITVGVVIGLHGVQGALKIKSFCEPPEAIFNYRPWALAFSDSSGLDVTPRRDSHLPRAACTAQTDVVQKQFGQVFTGVPLKIRGSGETLVARFPELEGRDAALGWVGAEVRVAQASLPKLPAGEYYWSDLIGLAVVNAQGVELGVITEMLATGSNDVMVVRGERERMLPYLPGQFVLAVDVAERRVTVDWDPEF